MKNHHSNTRATEFPSRTSGDLAIAPRLREADHGRCGGSAERFAGARCLAVIAIVFAIACAAFADEVTDQAVFASATEARDAGRYDEALSLFEAAVAGDPSNLAYRVGLARFYVDQGDAGRAIDVLSPFASAADDIELLRILGRAYSQANRLVEARRCFRRVLQDDDSTALDRLRLGRVYLMEDRCELAVRQFRDAQGEGLSSAELHVLFAKAYVRLGEYVGKLVLVTAPGLRKDSILDGRLLVDRNGDAPDSFIAAPEESAAFHIHRALDLGADALDVRLLEAEIWLRGRQYARAVAAHASLEPEILGSGISAARRAEFFASYSDALFSNDDLEGCLAKFAQAVEFDIARYGPGLAGAFKKVALRYNQRGDLERYIHHLSLATAEDPKSVDLHYRLGTGLMEAGKQRGAVRHWRITLQLSPDHPGRARMLTAIQAMADNRP